VPDGAITLLALAVSTAIAVLAIIGAITLVGWVL
jgi:hypothetical protein